MKNYRNKLWQNVLLGRRYKGWTYLEMFAYLVTGITRELKIAPDYFFKWHCRILAKEFKKKWLKKDGADSYFDFNGCKLPDISTSEEKYQTLMMVFEDIFLFSCFLNDNYNKENVLLMDTMIGEGPYCYVDGIFDVRIQKGDIVIDAGAWIGDFSAYAANKGATVYAFEPVEESFKLLCQTKDLNYGPIYPVQMGLGESELDINISIDNENSGAHSIIMKRDNVGEKIHIIRLDSFVKNNNIERVDFIKADIEGSERGMLRGATEVLKNFAPKLAICTYHLEDDPEVLEKIILEANPKYKIVHLKHKLVASVI
jgi:FkbM family methyltransferase